MLSRILEVFTGRDNAQEQLDPRRVQVATCVLLLEIAHADDGFTPQERDHVLEILRRRFNLSHTDAQELLEAAQEARVDSNDLFRFTSSINQACTPAERREIVREIWRVVYTDGELGSHEDHLIHRMATLLNLTHPQLIAEKLAAQQEHQR